MKVQSSVNTASDTNRPRPAASGNLSACMVAPFELDEPAAPRGGPIEHSQGRLQHTFQLKVCQPRSSRYLDRLVAEALDGCGDAPATTHELFARLAVQRDHGRGAQQSAVRHDVTDLFARGRDHAHR